MTKVNISFEDKHLIANFNESDTAKALLTKFPIELPMMNLYSREMTYRFKEALPAKKAKTSGYQVGDIGYWAPRHSFVIFYKETGEIIDQLQIVGHIDSDVSDFNQSGDVSIKFESKE